MSDYHYSRTVDMPFDDAIDAATAAPGAASLLTAREVEVLRLAARGMSNKEIGAALSISPKTADHHIQHIYDKIGVSTRAGAALFAMEHGLLTDRIG